MSEPTTEQPEQEIEPLAFDDPNRCPAAISAGYYCVLPIDHDGDHVWSEAPHVSAEPAEQIPPPADDWPICPVCAGNGRVPPELQASKEHATCPDCKGMGDVLTGSLKPDYAVQQCNRCTGNGWVYTSTLNEQAPQPASDFTRSY